MVDEPLAKSEVIRLHFVVSASQAHTTSLGLRWVTGVLISIWREPRCLRVEPCHHDRPRHTLPSLDERVMEKPMLAWPTRQ